MQSKTDIIQSSLLHIMKTKKRQGRTKRIRKCDKYLNTNVEWEWMNVPVSTETKQRRKQSTGTHPNGEEMPQVRSLGNVPTGRPQHEHTNQNNNNPGNAI